MRSQEYEKKISLALAALGIPFALIRQKKLPFHCEAQQLAVAEVDRFGSAHLLVPAAATAWHRLKDAAKQDQIALEIVSAFRNVDEQFEIIRAKLEQGLPLETILTLSAPPGYSEHHSGYAVDINTPGCRAREAPFEHTDAFRWLMANACRFGYSLSYPRGNSFGFIYEPWHWFFRGADDRSAGD